jgi:hypothetical protein
MSKFLARPAAAVALLLVAGVVPALAEGLPRSDGPPRPHGPPRGVRGEAAPPIRIYEPGNGPRWTSNGWSYAPVLPGPQVPVVYMPPPMIDGCCRERLRLHEVIFDHFLPRHR